MNTERKYLLVATLILVITPMTGASGNEKVLVIGLDGADWDVINPLIEQGDMPNLERLVDEGKHGDLKTTLPIESPVAWTSMTTGMTPGKHGIYGFLKKGEGGFVPTTAEDVRKERVWNHAGEKGETVVVNVPQTFPPGEVNGYMVSGYLSIKEAGYTYPEELQRDLEEMNYSIESLEGGFEPGREDEFLGKLNETVEKRTEASSMLLNRSDWRLGFVVYTGLDRLQHYFWNHREEGGKYDGTIEDHYRKLDRQIGELLEHSDYNTTVIVVSDHGFGPLEKNIYLNTWLRKEGYLELEDEEKEGLPSRIGLTQQNIVDKLSGIGLLQPLQDLFSVVGFNPGTKLPEPGMSDIDFSSTEVYAGNYGGKIYLTENVDDRESTLRELEEKLRDIEDPDTGEKVFREVYRKEDIYTGEMKGAPDLILEPERSYRAVGFLGHRSVVKEPPEKTGTHTREGIYVIKGSEVEPGKEDVRITDIAPTILDLLELEKLGDMDGESLIQDD